MAKAATILALIAGTGALLGLLGANLGVLSPMSGFTTFVGSALLGGIVTIVISLIAIFLSRGGRDPDAMRLALGGVAVGFGLLMIVLAAASPGSGLPPINDITTDLDNPPEFADSNVVPEYVGRNMSYPPEFVPQVREAYSDLKPIRLVDTPANAYAKAIAAAEELGWEISARSDERLVFDAQDETRLFRFVDDIAVRVMPDGSGSKVDIRSKSRDGRGDIGANAARIRKFAEAIQ